MGKKSLTPTAKDVLNLPDEEFVKLFENDKVRSISPISLGLLLSYASVSEQSERRIRYASQH